MSEIEDLQARISAALDRVAYRVEGMSADSGNTEALETALEEEKTANAQLEERVRTLKEKQAGELAAVHEQMQQTRAKVDTLDLELQRLRQANAQLRESNAALRTANESGVGEPHLINRAMMAELEALRTERAADVAEASAVLSAITPLLSASAEGETQDA